VGCIHSFMQIREHPTPDMTIIAQPERKYLAWIGGSIIGVLDTLRDDFVQKSEYDECGTTIIHRKFW